MRHLVDAFAARRAGAGEDHLAHESRLLLRDDLGDHAAHREPEEVDLVQAESADEGDRILRHIFDRRRGRPAGGTDTAGVEGDDRSLGGDAVHDARVPVVQDGGQVCEEDHRHPGARAEPAVGECHAAGVDGLRRHLAPGHSHIRVRGLLDRRRRLRSLGPSLCITIIISS
jgi:hypothetical protein